MTLTVRGPGMSTAGLRASYDSFERSISRMSSGLRITRAADDAAGLAISEGLRSRVNGSAVAARNVQDGIGMLQTAEGGLSSITSMLQRARDLAVQAASGGSLDAAAREAIAAETRQLVAEIDRTARATGSNGTRLLDGSRAGGFVFQVGADVGDTLSVDSYDVTAGALLLLGAAGTSTLSASSTYTAVSDNKQVFDLTGGSNVFSVSVEGGVARTFTVAEGVYDSAAEHTALRDALAAGFASLGVQVSVDHRTNGAGKGEFTLTASQSISLTGSGATAFGFPGMWTATADPGTAALSTIALADLVASGSADAITLVDDALATVLGARSQYGATQNRMEHRLSILASTGENLAAARSRIADADMAQEYAGLVRAQLLTQVGTAMQAQEAQSGQRVLQLLTSR